MWGGGAGGRDGERVCVVPRVYGGQRVKVDSGASLLSRLAVMVLCVNWEALCPHSPAVRRKSHL